MDEQVMTDQVLADAARLLRVFHDATVDFPPGSTPGKMARRESYESDIRYVRAIAA